MFLGKNYVLHISTYFVLSFTLNYTIKETSLMQFGAKICTYKEIYKLFIHFV